MKKIECFIQPSKLDQLEEVLWDSGVAGLTVSPVKGFGNQRVRPAPRLLDKFKIEIFVADTQVEEIISTIRAVVRTGQMGDGKIAVLPMEDLVRIRTGEKGTDAV